MAKDKLIFLFSFAFLGLIGAVLFRHTDMPPPVPENKTVAVEQTGDKKTLVLLAPQKENKKAELLPGPGKIAIPYQLTQRSSIAQFMNPGEFVDITFTSKGDSGFGRVSLTLLNDIKILGVGKDPDGNRSNYYKANTPIEVLLEMTPRQAEIFTYAQLSGDVSLGISEEAQNQKYSDLAEKLLQSESDANFNSILVTHAVRALFPKVNIEVTATAKGYIVSGKVPDSKTAERITKVLDLMAADGEKSIVNLLQEEPDSVEVLVAQENLKPNEPITLKDYKWEYVDPTQYHPSFVKRTPQSEKWLNEAVIANYVAKGQKIQMTDINWPEASKEKIAESLGISLDPGKSIVPFQITSRSPVAQFLTPGALVGVKFSSKADIGFGTVSFNLLEGIRVVAIAKDNEGKEFNKNRCMYKTCAPLEVFLEMTPRQAELLGFAQTAGNLNLEIAESQSQFGQQHRLVENLSKTDSAADFQSVLVTDMVRTLFPNVDIKLTAAPKGYILEGKIPDPQVAAKIIEILARLVPEGEKSLVNLMEVQPQQVLISVKVLEITKDYLQNIGLNWSAVFQHNGATATMGAVYPTPNLPNPNFFISEMGAQFGLVSLTGLLDLLEEEGNGRTLAEPNLTTISGQKAHFFAGGEFPILIPQGGSGLVGSITVEFKKYGVTLDFTPVVDLNGLITLHVAPEVSNIDPENQVELNGYVIPSLLSRSADTIVKLWPGQSYIIAGLLEDQYTKVDDRIRGLCDIPILGQLFNSSTMNDQRKELIIIVTPFLMSEERPVCPPCGPCVPCGPYVPCGDCGSCTTENCGCNPCECEMTECMH